MLRRSSLHRHALFTFSEAHPALLTAQHQHGFNSNVWLQASSIYNRKARSNFWNLVYYYQPTTVKDLSQTKMLYNLDQFNIPVQKLFVPQTNSSGEQQQEQFCYGTRKPFPPEISEQLFRIKQERKFESRCWVDARTARWTRMKFCSATDSPKRDPVFVNTPPALHQFINTDQIVLNAGAIQQYPVCARTGMNIDESLSKVCRRQLQDAVKHRKYNTGLFFSAADLAYFNLVHRVRPHARPVRVQNVDKQYQALMDSKMRRLQMFNVECIFQPHFVQKKLPITTRMATNDATSTSDEDSEKYHFIDIFKAERITCPRLKEKMENHPQQFETKDWASYIDLKKRGYRLLPGHGDYGVVKPHREAEYRKLLVQYHREKCKYMEVTDFFNVDELIAPEEGFAVAGQLRREKGVLTTDAEVDDHALLCWQLQHLLGVNP